MAVTLLAVHVTYAIHVAADEATGDVTTLPNGGMRCMLGTRNAWTPDVTDDFVNDALSAGFVELTDGSYSRAPVVLTGIAQDDGYPGAYLTADPIDFGTPVGAEDYDTLIIYGDVGVDGGNWLIATYDLGGTFSTDGSGITFTPDAAGLVGFQIA